MTRIETAKEEGKIEGKIELIQSLLLLDVDIEKIIKASGYTKEEIENIKKQMHQEKRL